MPAGSVGDMGSPDGHGHLETEAPGSERPLPGSERPLPGSERPAPGSERPLPGSEGLLPGPEGPPAGPGGPASGWGAQPVAAPTSPPRSGPFGPPPPPRAPHRWGLWSYVLVEVVFLGVSLLLGLLLGRSLASSAGAIALALAVPTVCAALLALVITKVRGNGPVVDLGLRVTGRDLGIGLACGVAGLAITIPASLLYMTIVGKGATSAVGEVFGGLRATPAMAVLVFVVVVFLAPLCEEIVYRGLLWGAVERRVGNRWWAMAVTTVVFALAHLELTRAPLLLVVALPIGIARAVTGRLPAGVVAHQINNLLPGLALALALVGVLPMS